MFLANPLNGSSLAFPLLEGVHLIGIVCGVGTASLVNLRLIGLGTKTGPATVWRDTWLLTMGGLTLAIFAGLMLFSVDPERYYENQAFRFKLGALLAALLFYYTLVRRAAIRDRPAPVVAVISLVLYALVPLSGIYIGYE
jgi:hypothetical protein